ncbi:MAG: GNAT family N-acetyltransferase [Candidatus Lokiarchaeota archaeon]|nr:GNAT family N-acetyltransferase [Candidatus Lokiarchaeota archaeon]
MKIKDVSIRDLRSISNLEHQIFKENAFSIKLVEKLIQQNILFLKLEDGKIMKKLIGFIVVIKDREDQANIINFLIHPQFQSKGYGSLLLQETIERIKKRLKEIKKIVLNVQVNNSLAIKLYEKFNFQKNSKIIENYYQSGEDAYLMELST